MTNPVFEPEERQRFTQCIMPVYPLTAGISNNLLAGAVRRVLEEHLSVYFKYFDSDYGDLKKLLNMEPLQITILRYGTIAAYERERGHRLQRINPSMLDVCGMLKVQSRPLAGEGGRP